MPDQPPYLLYYEDDELDTADTVHPLDTVHYAAQPERVTRPFNETDELQRLMEQQKQLQTEHARLRAQLDAAKRAWRKYSDYLFDNDLSMNNYIFRLGQALGELE